MISFIDKNYNQKYIVIGTKKEKKMRMPALMMSGILTLSASGCFYSYNRQTLTYNSKVKDVKISGDSCTLTVDPPALGRGVVTGIKAGQCEKLSKGDDVTIRETTLNGRQSAIALKGIHLNLP